MRRSKYFGFKERPSKTTDRQKLVLKVDIAFSEFIKLRDADNQGMITCITCGDRQHYSHAQCGHYMKRGNASTRYDLKNSAGQCSTCNCALDGMQEEHGKAIDRLYGEGTADRLEKQSRQVVHFSEPELQGMLEELRKEIKALKIEKLS